MKISVVIPARFASKRLPGKPLVLIQGSPMLKRVYQIAKKATEFISDVTIFVATDDERIVRFCKEVQIPCILTPSTCSTGTDRVFAALSSFENKPDFVINLQGDMPLTPPAFIRDMVLRIKESPTLDVITACEKLTWQGLDRLREEKKTTPFSGTCVTLTEDKRALWFSKQMIPAIRNEEHLRGQITLSPVYRHIGLYGYSYKALKHFCHLKPSYYENLEGLEQLRFLENGISIQMIIVDYRGRTGLSGVDSKEDVERAEAVLKAEGELI